MFIFLHQLSMPSMFIVVLLVCLAVCWIVIGLVRSAVAYCGYESDEPLPIRDSVIGSCTTIFGLMVAFSAAGLWNDAIAARNAVQREADAIENAVVLSAALPVNLQERIEDRLKAYVANVISIDWPAMSNGESADSSVFDKSERFLLEAIGLLSRQQASVETSVAYAPLVDQLLAVRHARLARLSASDAGMSWAQWIAIWIISTTTVFAIAICNNHAFRMQIVATHIFVVVVSAAYFVILAYDRPFVGTISIKPAAFLSLNFDALAGSSSR